MNYLMNALKRIILHPYNIIKNFINKRNIKIYKFNVVLDSSAAASSIMIAICILTGIIIIENIIYINVAVNHNYSVLFNWMIIADILLQIYYTILYSLTFTLVIYALIFSIVTSYIITNASMKSLIKIRLFDRKSISFYGKIITYSFFMFTIAATMFFPVMDFLSKSPKPCYLVSYLPPANQSIIEYINTVINQTGNAINSVYFLIR